MQTENYLNKSIRKTGETPAVISWCMPWIYPGTVPTAHWTRVQMVC